MHREGHTSVSAEARQNTAADLNGIYVIVGPDRTRDRSVQDVARGALNGGACAIQLRDKHSNENTLRRSADVLRRLCDDAGALLIINDDPSLARSCSADGVHVGQSDVSICECRSVLDPRQITGKSNANEIEAELSLHEGADYIAVGSIFPTRTKLDSRPSGLDTLRRVAGLSTAPVVAIGGINVCNVGAVAEAGADAVCVVSAVSDSDCPERATRELLRNFRAGSG